MAHLSAALLKCYCLDLQAAKVGKYRLFIGPCNLHKYRLTFAHKMQESEKN